MDFLTSLLLYAFSFIAELGLLALLLLLSKRMLGWVARGTFDIEEVVRGNVAAALLSSSTILALVMGCWPYFNSLVLGMAFGLVGDTLNPTVIVTLLFNPIISLVFVVALVALSVRGCTLVCGDLQVSREIKKGNVAVAILLSLVILIVVGLFSPFLSTVLTTLQARMLNQG